VETKTNSGRQVYSSNTGVGDSGGNTPAMCAALDALARLPADNDDNDKFANVGGGEMRWSRWPGDWRRDDHQYPQSIRAAIDKGQSHCGTSGNGTD
jgi:hypothetical protein